MNTILLPIDSSIPSQNAIKYAAELSILLQKKLVIVNIFQLPVSYTEVPLVTIGLNEIEEGSKKLLNDAKGIIEKISKGKIKIETIARYGDTVNELIKLNNELNPYLIIIGTAGVSGIEKLFLGSISIDLIKKTMTPVLVIPPNAKYTVIKNIGLTTDFKKITETVSLNVLNDIILTCKSTLSVIHVDYERYHFTAETPMESINLDQILHGFKPNYHYIEDKNITDAIINYTKKSEVELLVVYPKKRTWFDNLFETSITRKIIHQTEVPILCLRN